MEFFQSQFLQLKLDDVVQLERQKSSNYLCQAALRRPIPSTTIRNSPGAKGNVHRTIGIQVSGCGSIEAHIEPLHCRIKRSLP